MKLVVICCVLVMLSAGCTLPSRGVYVTVCEQRARGYVCGTAWVRPVPVVEVGDYAYEWSCVRPGGRLQRAQWLREW